MTLSTTFKSELRGRYQTPVICLLKITHSTFPSIVRLADNPDDVVSNGNTFTKFRFDFVPPKQSKEINTDFNVILPNIDNTFLAASFGKMARTEAPKFSVYIVRALTPDTIEDQYLDCDLVTTQVEETQIACVCRWESVLRQPVSRVMSRQFFPGLYRDG